MLHLIFCRILLLVPAIQVSSGSREVACPAPPRVAHGVYTCQPGPHRLNALCELHCEPLYRPVPSHSDIRCESTNRWSAHSSCQEVACPAPPKVLHGVYTCTHGSPPYRKDEICQLQCDHGYRPNITHSHIRCTRIDLWTPSASCREIRCPDPPKITGGNYVCRTTPHTLSDVCHLQCTPGYKPSIANSDITCLYDSSWSPLTSCVEIKCPSPPAVAHGTYRCASSTSHKLNDTCHLQCSTGYKPRKPMSHLTCLSSDKWSTHDSCIEIKCPAPPKVLNGHYSCSSPSVHKLNDVCHLQCTSGYKRNTSHSDITCLASDTWSTPASCTEIRCPAPPKITGGNYVCRTTPHKPSDVCHLQCTPGYKPSIANSDITCLSSASWSPLTSCVEIKCPPPPKVLNGHYSCSSSTVYKLNDVCHLQCTSGYKRNTSHSDITCLASDTWSTPASCAESPRECEVCSGPLCGAPGNIHLQQCPSSKPYCMNHVHYINGTISVTKSCGSDDECISKWWQGTSDRDDCINFNPASPKRTDLSCYYCCSVSGCNRDVVPSNKTLSRH